jgi:hypothetical protein
MVLALIVGLGSAAHAQKEDHLPYELIRLGMSQAEVEAIAGKTNRWNLRYPNGSADFVDGELKEIWPKAEPGKKPALPIEIGMSRSAVEGRLGPPQRECAQYDVNGNDHVFCYQGGEVVGKSRRLPDQPRTS